MPIQGKHNFGGSLLGWLLALPTNIRLSWKGLPNANTLANFKNLYIADVKSLITLGLGVIFTTLHFLRNFINGTNKPECYII
jgi:hypothetical protein